MNCFLKFFLVNFPGVWGVLTLFLINFIIYLFFNFRSHFRYDQTCSPCTDKECACCSLSGNDNCVFTEHLWDAFTSLKKELNSVSPGPWSRKAL